VEPQLQILIDLQSHDTRIAGLEAEVARLPREIETIQAGLAEAKKTLDTLRAKADTTRKELRLKEKDLEVTAAKRSKAEGRLYEVKTNKEYSAVLVEIEDIKQEKAKAEEEILALMELQERLGSDIREAEAVHKRREEQARRDEAVVRERLSRVEAELDQARGERSVRARELPPLVLGEYEKRLRARGGLAVVPVTVAAVCGGCRMTVRPQALQEVRAGAELITCENCGRYLYWQE
jgi:uncharacterized protein